MNERILFIVDVDVTKLVITTHLRPMNIGNTNTSYPLSMAYFICVCFFVLDDANTFMYHELFRQSYSLPSLRMTSLQKLHSVEPLKHGCHQQNAEIARHTYG